MNKANKIRLNGEILIDLTADTVTSEKLAKGTTAHDKSGALIEGTLAEPIFQEKTATANGEVIPDEGYDGLSKVTVNVEAGETVEEYDGSYTLS